MGGGDHGVIVQNIHKLHAVSNIACSQAAKSTTLVAK